MQNGSKVRFYKEKLFLHGMRCSIACTVRRNWPSNMRRHSIKCRSIFFIFFFFACKDQSLQAVRPTLDLLHRTRCKKNYSLVNTEVGYIKALKICLVHRNKFFWFEIFFFGMMISKNIISKKIVSTYLVDHENIHLLK